jgi:Tol biopolymer transport system component
MIFCILLISVFLSDRIPLVVIDSSSDGLLVYIIMQRYITSFYSFDLHSGATTPLTSENVRGYSPTWSPDGCRIAYVSGIDIFVLDLATGLKTNLTGQFRPDRSLYRYPSWSPDGAYMAYSSNSGGEFGLYILDIENMKEARLTDADIITGSSTWSPDSNYLVFEGRIDNGSSGVFSIRIDGTDIQEIYNHGGGDYTPALSPDGEKIAFSSNQHDSWDIYVMNADGSDVKRLTFDEGTDGEPDWSPDGERIAFSSNRGGNWELYIMNADGSDVQQLTDESFVISQSPRWQPTACKV